MTATQHFIEDAIAGGWRPDGFPLEEKSEDIAVGYIVGGTEDDAYPIRFSTHEYPEEGYFYSMSIEPAVLAPLAWQAVGKTRRWEVQDAEGTTGTPQYSNWFPYSWGWRWHRFIDAVADGRSIEEALALITA